MESYFQINAEKYNIRCKLYASDPGQIRRLVLFGHGFGGHKDNRAAERFAKRVLKKNRDAAVLTFNWPCHGDDVRKTLRLEDCSAYLEHVIAYARERYRAPVLMAYATSFGGYLFLRYVSEAGNPFERMAFRCPAVNMYDVITGAIMTEENRAQIARGKSALVGFDRKIEIDGAFLRSLQENDLMQRDFHDHADGILILQGTDDEVVPFEAVRAFATQNGVAFVPVEGADHRFQKPEKMDFAIAQIAAFFGL